MPAIRDLITMQQAQDAAVASPGSALDNWFRYTEADLTGDPDFTDAITGEGYNDAGAGFGVVPYAVETNVSAAAILSLPAIGTSDFLFFIHGLPEAVGDTNFLLSLGDATSVTKYVWADTVTLYFGDALSITLDNLSGAAETFLAGVRRGNVMEFYRGTAGGPVTQGDTLACTGFDLTGWDDLFRLNGTAELNERAVYNWGVAKYTNGAPSKAQLEKWLTYMRDGDLLGYKLIHPEMLAYARS